MKLVYTNEDRFKVNAMRSFLESHGVPCFVKNEHLSSIMGEIPFFETWPELWVAEEIAPKASELITQLKEPNVNRADWVCSECQEENPGTFDFCWQCECSY